MTSDTPRLFHLHRDTDITGASGTGRVADGVLWPDGTVTIRWRGERPSTVNWSDIDDAEAIHGHGGATRIVWADLPDSVPEPTEFSQRGFARYAEIPTDYGHEVSLYESSAAESACVWLKIGDSDRAEGHSAHMTTRQALALRDALNVFLAHRS